MASTKPIQRTIPTSGNIFANGSVTIEAASTASRISLRANPRGAKSFGKSHGINLPTIPGTSMISEQLAALWIGPDEWLVIDEKRSVEALLPKRESKEFCAVDVSHRNTAFLVSGPRATDTLNAACPRNLSLTSFPVGTASRTIFGKAEIVLLRTGNAAFRVECWRSFAPYVWELLLDAARTLQDQDNLAAN
jgi:sarcosine oxidase subunit gamma